MPYPEGTVFKDSYVARVAYTQYRRIKEETKTENMNETFDRVKRDMIKEGLAKCTEPQQLFFKRMYAHGKLELPINEVVDKMPSEKLDWAMSQIETQIKKNAIKQQEGQEG